MLFRLVSTVVIALYALPARAASVDGVNIDWTSYGIGRQIVMLVHCSGCDSTTWREQIAALARNYRVITLDLPGHGRSGQAATLSMDLFVRAVEAVRAEAGAERIVLAGHANGAVVIRRYALTYPERVAGLVLVEGVLLIGDRNGHANVPPERTVRELGVGVTRADLIRGSTLRGTTSPELQGRILTMMLAVPDEVVAQTQIAMYQPSESMNEPINLPVLAIYGTGVATERAVKVLYPRAEYHRIADAGHFPMMSAPDVVSGLVDGFLARNGF